MLTTEISVCPVCGLELPAKVWWVGVVNGHRLNYKVCECGSAILSPRMSDEETLDYYRLQYRNGISEHDIAWQKFRANVHVTALKAVLEETVTLLDIGCSGGYFASELISHVKSARTVGVDPDPQYRHYASEYDALEDTLDLVPAQNQFSLIHMSHVLEHINNPTEYLRNLSVNYAAPDAKLLVEVPLREYNSDAYLVHHPIAFSVESLLRCVELGGWDVENIFFHNGLKGYPLSYFGVVIAKRKA